MTHLCLYLMFLSQLIQETLPVLSVIVHSVICCDVQIYQHPLISSRLHIIVITYD